MERLAVLHRWRIPDDVAEISAATRPRWFHDARRAHRRRAARRGGIATASSRDWSTDRDGRRRSPRAARTDVPVHADCYWENWLASDGDLTALLDFEWARFGDPLDDYVFLVSFSGEHEAAVIDGRRGGWNSGAALRREWARSGRRPSSSPTSCSPSPATSRTSPGSCSRGGWPASNSSSRVGAGTRRSHDDGPSCCPTGVRFAGLRPRTRHGGEGRGCQRTRWATSQPSRAGRAMTAKTAT